MPNASLDQPTRVELLQLQPQQQPNQAAYDNIPTAIRFQGKLNVDVLMQTLTEMAHRHERLRPTFPNIDSQPTQQVTKPARVTVIDLQAMPKAKQRQEVDRRIQAEANQVSDLVGGPLIRISLLKLSADEHILLYSRYHITTVQWSDATFIEEVTALYRTYLQSEPSTQPEPSLQYSDYAQ